MDFNSKKFWFAVALEIINFAAMFMGMITFDQAMAKAVEIAVGWGVLDVGATGLKAFANAIATKKTNGGQS